MTVCENVMYPLKLLRHSDADAKKEAQIALEKVGLGESYWKQLAVRRRTATSAR